SALGSGGLTRRQTASSPGRRRSQVRFDTFRGRRASRRYWAETPRGLQEDLAPRSAARQTPPLVRPAGPRVRRAVAPGPPAPKSRAADACPHESPARSRRPGPDRMATPIPRLDGAPGLTRRPSLAAAARFEPTRSPGLAG